MEYSGKGSPSSGFVGVWLMLQQCAHVHVYGVGLGGPVQGTAFEDSPPVQVLVQATPALWQAAAT